MSSRCIDAIPEHLREAYPNLVKFASLYQSLIGEPDEFWEYISDYILNHNGGKAIAMDRPIYNIIKASDRQPISMQGKYIFSMWVALYKTLYNDLNLNLKDPIGYKLFIYIGRYAFWMLLSKIEDHRLVTKEDILSAIDQSLFINLFTGWVCLTSCPIAGLTASWVQMVKNMCWDFARGRVPNRSISEFLKNSPYFWINKIEYKAWGDRSLKSKLEALYLLYDNQITDPRVFSNTQSTLESFLVYHPETSKVRELVARTEKQMYTYLKHANPSYTRNS